jgi:hypothetical protein
VARIEQALGPKGITVKSPDHIPDVVTGEEREVDASIRYKAGSVEILITVECRKRKNVQDIRWIEELAMKKQNIGASKTIAVSSKAFTQPAINLAKRYGIDVRILKLIHAAELETWIKVSTILTRHYHVDLKHLLVVVEQRPPSEPVLDKQVEDQVTKTGAMNTAFFIRPAEGTKVSLKQILYPVVQKLYEQIRPDQEPFLCKRVLNFERGQLTVPLESGIADVTHLEVDATVQITTKVVPFEDVVSFKYSDPQKGDDVVEGLECSFVQSGRKIWLSFHRSRTDVKLTVSSLDGAPIQGRIEVKAVESTTTEQTM